ncbi:hypothetical protein [Zunongwangia sp. HGR-M22]|uniref:hypothetical protein n=1 Tax=Zunongwangia sp. HGR-M22 TaxID=3015168 RepID=UPI0022DE1847|nr:hypothetical protein [Zunongwangia sp. HGR-M22]WBL26763.1 hypothetical protein PBT91_05745 [Zunongwangia sp. HGR-M22]
MRKLLALTLIISLNSCFFYKKDGIEVNIKNNSSETISKIEFTTSEKVKFLNFDSIEPNKSVREFLPMSKNESDGAYLLTFERADGKNETCGGGYYTNGSSLDHWVDFFVENDTTIVKFDAPIY